jgi:hypothetical protein
MFRKAGREAAFFAAYLLLSIALTWPLARNLSTTLSDLGDPLLVSWILDWTSHALLTQPLRLFHSPMYYPTLMPHAFSEHLTGIALVTLPFHAAGVPPLAIHNIAMLLGFALSGYGAFVLARMFVPSLAAAFISGIFFAFVPFKFDHLPHLQIIFSGWLPLVLAAVLAYRRKPGWKRALWITGAFAMNGLTNIYFMLFSAAAVGATLIVLFFVDEKRGWKFWLRIVAALALAGLILLPFLLPYRVVSDKYNMKRPENEVLHGSGALSDWMRSPARSLLYGELIPGDKHLAEREIFPGIMAFVLIGCAIVMTPRRERLPGTSIASARLLRALDILIVILAVLTILGAMSEPRFLLRAFDRTLIAIRGTDLPFVALLLVTLARLSLRLPAGFGGLEQRSLRDSARDSRFNIDSWAAALWIVVGALGALGLHAFFYRFLYERIDAYRSMRALGRWAVIAYVGIAVWMAIGAWTVISRRTGRQRTIASAALVALTLLDVFPSIQWEQALVQTPPVYRWLNRERKGPVLELPIDNWLAFRYLHAATQHRVMLMNGSSGWEGPTYRDMRIGWDEREYERALRIAEENGAAIFIVHEHWMTNADTPKFRAMLRNELQHGRVAFLRRFDHGVEGDFVFAITRNFPDWQRLRTPNAPDGAGHLPEQMLARFLEGQPTYNASMFGRMERPAYFETAKGPLKISGWAISPNGISNVYVHVDERSKRYEAHRTKRPDISSKYPWYYEYDCGFELTIPDRPSGVHRYTDVQIELVDGTGRRMWLEDHLVTWLHSTDEE